MPFGGQRTMPKLVLLQGEQQKQEFALQDELVVIGRSRQATLRFDDKSLSGKHAMLLRVRDGYCIEDLESRNGLWVNSRRVRRHQLTSGDVVEVGQLRFRFDADC